MYLYDEFKKYYDTLGTCAIFVREGIHGHFEVSPSAIIYNKDSLTLVVDLNRNYRTFCQGYMEALK